MYMTFVNRVYNREYIAGARSREVTSQEFREIFEKTGIF